MYLRPKIKLLITELKRILPNIRSLKVRRWSVWCYRKFHVLTLLFFSFSFYIMSLFLSIKTFLPLYSVFYIAGTLSHTAKDMLKAFVYRHGNHRILLLSSTFDLTGVRAVKHHGARGRKTIIINLLYLVLRGKRKLTRRSSGGKRCIKAVCSICHYREVL